MSATGCPASILVSRLAPPAVTLRVLAAFATDSDEGENLAAVFRVTRKRPASETPNAGGSNAEGNDGLPDGVPGELEADLIPTMAEAMEDPEEYLMSMAQIDLAEAGAVILAEAMRMAQEEG
jgi:hypothetical protein